MFVIQSKSWMYRQIWYITYLLTCFVGGIKLILQCAREKSEVQNIYDHLFRLNLKKIVVNK